jgi:curli biogenesis system outer membrane secretion channel CsgG
MHTRVPVTRSSRIRPFARRFRHLATATLAIAVASAFGAVAQGQGDAAGAGKPRLAIREIAASKAVQSQAGAEGALNVLNQIVEGADPQLMTAIDGTRRFELVARADLPSVIKEQNLAESGNVNTLDPQAAKALQLAGAAYLATVTIDNFQDVTERTVLPGQFGDSQAERRTIQIQGVVKIFNSTTGTLYRSTAVTLNESAVDEVLAGVQQQGRKTNALIGKVTALFATAAANAITESLAPAKVVGYTMGQITFNRTADLGVRNGQIWEVLAPGQEMVDPDTGEALGSEEIRVGWARVTNAGPRSSTAQAIEDFGIDRGSIMRLRPEGLPAGVDPNGKANGSASPGAVGSPARPAGAAPAAPVVPPAGANAQGAGSASGSAAPAAGGAAALMKVAIFVKQRPGCIPEDKVSVLEDDLTAAVTSGRFEVIRREDVVNAVNRFAPAGPNAGTGTPESELADRLLSSQTSAVNLAANMNAAYLLTAAITTFDKNTRAFQDPSLKVETVVTEWTLDVTYSILDGTTGGSLVSGSALSRVAVRQTPELAVEIDALNRCLRESAGKIGVALNEVAARGGIREGATPAADTRVQITAVLADLSVPEAVKGPDGQYTVTANQYRLEPMNVSVMVDGMVIGQTPGTYEIRPGLHRIRLERPGLEPVERMINVKPGLAISIPMQLSPEGRANWERNARFFSELQNGAVLREAELIRVNAMAEFLKQSSVRIDTSNVQNLNVGGQSLWWQLLNP